MKHHRAGFTIVELLIVVVVIAILAAITIVSYNGIQNQAKASAAQSAAKQGYKKIASFAIQNSDQYPADLAATGLASSGDTAYQYRVDNTANPKVFCLTTTANGTSYFVSNGNDTPLPGACAGHGGAEITNVAPNPSYETTAGWHSNDWTVVPTAVDTNIFRTGSQSIRSSNVAASNALSSMYAVGAPSGNGHSVPAQAGTYTHSVYFRADVPHSAILSIGWRVGGVWSSGISSAAVQGTPGEWTRATQTYTIPANVEFVRSGLRVSSTISQPAGTPAWADDYMNVQGSTPRNYADGNSPGWVWTGAKNNSTSVGPSL